MDRTARWVPLVQGSSVTGQLSSPRATLSDVDDRTLLDRVTERASDPAARALLHGDVHDEVGRTRQDCAEMGERVLELMCQALERGEQVKLSGFGVFQVRAKRARMGRNPKTGTPAAIVPRRVIGFRASQVMKARVDRALSR